MTEFESRCYGMSEDELRKMYGSYIKVIGTEMFVAGLLSDCQELIAASDANADKVRRLLNVAKFFLFEKMERAA